MKQSMVIGLAATAVVVVLLIGLAVLAWVGKNRNRVAPPVAQAPEVQPNPGPARPNPAQPAPPAQVTGDPALDKALADLKGSNLFACQTALNNLARMQPNEHQPLVAQQLAALATNSNPQTRTALIKALGTWGTANEVPILIQAIEDSNPFTREEALKAVGKFKDERALEPVLRCFRKLGMREPAGKALREMGPMAEKEVLALLQEKDMLLRNDAIKVLKDIGTQASVPPLEQVAADNSAVFLRQSAREALAAIAARTKP
jgi:hypothetical protein